MKRPHPHTFDSRGFFFGVKFFSLVFLFIFAFQYGTHLFFDNKSFGEAYAAVVNEGSFRSDVRVKSANARTETYESIQAHEEEFLATQTLEGHTLASVIPDKGKFIGVDLVNMKLLLYQDGEAVQTLPVLSRGKSGSHWETPSGVYEIKTKERNHFSSIGHVYMPYSMQFFGNFFIHGWPYYSNGDPVPKGYSGGCVRLSTEDAEKVFEFADVGTGIFVYEGSEKEGDKNPFVKVRAIEPPSMFARSYLVADIETGQIYAAKYTSIDYPIASVTKLMTAVVANETISFDKRVPIVDTGLYIPPDVSRINEELLIGELLYPLILESNNRVAASIAAYYGTDLFLKWMNDKAEAVGMGSTFFDDASGLSSENISTVKDLYHLARYVYEKKSFIFHMSTEDARTIISNSGKEYVFHNKTHFLDRDDYLGGKIGYTPEALETMVALFEVPIDGKEHVVAVIVLGANSREGAVLELLHWLKKAT